MLAWLRERWNYGLTADTRRRMHEFERRYGQQLDYEAQLQALPIESARREAMRLLAATALLVATPVEGAPTKVSRLAPELRDFFSRYRRVQTTNGAIYADAGTIEPCGWRAGFLEIGACDGHVHLMVRPGEEAVYEVADDVAAHEQVLATFPSIHHWVLALHFGEELAEGDA
jgi:hypothetical protein